MWTKGGYDMRKNKLKAMVLSAGMAAVMLAGCGNTTTGAEDNKTTEVQTEASTQTEVSTQTESGDKAEGSEQVEATEQTETEEAGNVVASSVAIVEILDAMNIPMVGVPTSSYTLPESVADATEIGNPMSPDMEVITSLEPDYIISVNSLEADLGDQFKATGATTYFADLSSYEGLKTTITDLGALFGNKDAASAVIAGLEEKEANVEAEVEGKEAPTVLIIFGAGDSFMAASDSTYVGDLVRLAGGVNVVTDAPSGFSPIDMEYLAEQNPDYILLMAHANPEESLKALQNEFDTNEAWQNFDAVTNDRVYALETGYFGMSANLQAGDALEKLVEILYQEN